MRYALMLAALAAILAPGCQKKPKGPQTTAIDSEPRPLEGLKPAAAPPAQTRRFPAKDTSSYVDKIKRPGADKLGAAKAPAKPRARYYTVQQGDRGGFYGIARKLYGDPRRWKEIEALNPGVDTTKLKIGQKIRVPQK